MTSKQKATARKLHNMFIDNATTDNEKEVAKNKLIDMLKKHKASLSDFVDNVENSDMFNFSEKVKVSVKRSYLLSDRSKKSGTNKKSRRAIIISMLKENKHTKLEIATFLLNTFQVADLKNNLKAVSGTIYDLSSNNKATFKIDNETDIVTSVFA